MYVCLFLSILNLKMAPEILKGQRYTELVDMWAMGVVTYIMLCGFPPFDGDSDTDVLCNIMNISYEFPSPGRCNH
jgi:serine/threonine protein kinase